MKVIKRTVFIKKRKIGFFDIVSFIIMLALSVFVITAFVVATIMS